jgi:hypothetical protein
MYNQDLMNCYSHLYNGLIFSYRNSRDTLTCVNIDRFVRGLININDYTKYYDFYYIASILDKQPFDCVNNDLRSTFNHTVDAFLFLRKSEFDLFDLLRQFVYDIKNLYKELKEDTVYIVYSTFLEMFFKFFHFYTRRSFSTNLTNPCFGDLTDYERNSYFFNHIEYYKDYYVIYIYNGLYKYGKVKNIKTNILENSQLLHIVNNILIFEDFRSYLRICNILDKNNEGKSKYAFSASYFLYFSFCDYGNIFTDFLKARDYIHPNEEKTKLNVDF